jgi:prolyl-tRNA synthetase
VLLRTAEFLWQEGHTAHASEAEAREETERMLEVYREFAESFLAIPVITGEKPAEERFPGAVMSLSIEAMMQDGKALQAGTTHYLGQGFAEAAEIEFVAADGEREFVHTSSWGVSTRLLGALIMSHSDDEGLRLPPRVAPQQVVVVPILRGEQAEAVREYATALAAELQSCTYGGEEVRASADLRDREAPAKRWEWVRKGVPLIIEVGPRDLEQDAVMLRRRDSEEGGGETVARAEIAARVPALLEEVQAGYLAAAADRLAARTARDIADLGDFRRWFEGDDGDPTSGGFVRAPWSEAPESAAIMEELKVSVRCIPFDQELAPGSACVLTGKPALVEAIFAKAY